MHAANRPVVTEPARTLGLMDPGPVLRAFRPGDHGEQTSAEPVPDPVEVLVQIHRKSHGHTVRGRGGGTGDRVPGPAQTSRH